MKLCLLCNQYFEEPCEKCPSDGSILENVGKDPLIGALINNRYLVDSVIGKGSSGIVYKARRLGRGEMVVAIKVLHSYIGAAGASLDRFLRELQAASKLRNPHIMSIWDSGVTEDGQPYFVMDYLEGTTLGYLIKERGNLEPKRVLSLLHQICEALAEAHRHGIVHRDLKPENVVLQQSDHGHDYVKLLDFGIADSPQHAQSSFKLEKPRTVSGSPAYMSPEQCQGLELDGRSDIYSLAIVAFEMLTGCRPFPQLENVNVMVLHVNEPPMTLSAVRPDLQFPEEVEHVIAKALSKQPSDRQTSVQEFLLEFELAWQNQGNPLSVLAKAVVQEKPNLSESISALKKEEYAKAITCDELVVQQGDELVPAWGKVSLQSPNKTAATVLENNPPNTFKAKATGGNISMAELAKKEELVRQDELDKPTAELPVQQPVQQPIQQPVQQNIKEQSITKSKTVDRLMEAAKRGQSGGQQKLSRKDLPLSQTVRKDLPQPDTITSVPANASFALSNNVMPNSNIPYSAGIHKSQTPSGWFPLQDKQAIMPSAEPTVRPSPPYVAAANSLPTTLSQGNKSASLSAVDIPASKSDASKSPGSLSGFAASADPTESIPMAEAVRSYSKQAMNDTGQASARRGIEKTPEEEFFIKQKYRTTLSRLQGWRKSRQADNSLISTRARAAALKAETVRPPVNLWFFAITIVTAACLLACGYIVYSALGTPIPPVTSLDVLLSSGKYEQVIDILEGKQLSEPLTETDRNELSEAYLHRAKENLAAHKSAEAMSLLAKIDPKSPSAAEADLLKAQIMKVKNSGEKNKSANSKS